MSVSPERSNERAKTVYPRSGCQLHVRPFARPARRLATAIAKVSHFFVYALLSSGSLNQYDLILASRKHKLEQGLPQEKIDAE